MNIRVLLADDHTILRKGIRNLLEKEKGLEVVGEAEDGRKAVEMVQKLQPDIVLMDISMPHLNGVGAAREIASTVPNCKVIALSMYSGKKFVMEMLRAGASGFLVKDCLQEELITAIHTVAEKKVYLSPSIADIVAAESIRQTGTPATADSAALTPRERETIQLIAEGSSSKQIAAKLRVSVKTVDTYRQNVMKKLGVHSVAELTKYAVREGLTSLDE
jgi:DNA-binding NarL/FixJ family response regulator